MNPIATPSPQREGFGELAETILRLVLLAGLLIWCYRIIAPFLTILIWAAVLAIACRPMQSRLAIALGGRAGLAAGIMAAVLLLVLLVPVVILSGSVMDGAAAVGKVLDEGTLHIPRPHDALAQWPLIGGALHRALDSLATNTEAALRTLAPHLKSLGTSIIGALGRGSVALLQFAAAAVVAAALLANTDRVMRTMNILSQRIFDEHWDEILQLATATVRSVFKGVIGVAVIQAVLAGIGILAIGIPGAGFWAMLVLILAIVQLPPLLVLAPMIIWVFATAETVPAILFAIWSILVSLSDGVLKPALLGRGVSVPTLVILIGAIGGMLTAGVIGLFIGPLVLALAYTLFGYWLRSAEAAAPPQA